MNSLFIIISLGPMALYLLVLAFINSRSCPTVVSGKRDLIFLGLGLIGFVFIGPIQMLVPINAIIVWKFWVWFLLLSLYFLLIVFLGTFRRPQIILYNISYDEARSLLSRLALELDFEARWAGASLNLPGLGIQFYLENCSFLKNVSLIAAGEQPDLRGWNRLEEALVQATRNMKSGINPANKYFVALGIIIFIYLLIILIGNREIILESLKFYLFS
ncbi:MAG: hypothetical protein Q4C95_00100 [Planctomycetia bacterium]|nr:hypothetical protein [Planctomycetia bacterium]